MKDDLEKYISDHREEFDILEPGDHVWENIVLREKPKERGITFKTVLLRVAAVVVIFVAAYITFLLLNQPQEKMATQDLNKDTIQLQIPEIIEAETYYTSLVNQKLDELNEFKAQFPEIEQDVRHDLTELDSVYMELKNDLNENVASEEVIDAMIQNYRLKLDILEEMLEFLRSTTEENNESETYRHEV